MSKIIFEAVGMFKELAPCYGEQGIWLEENIQAIMEYLYHTPIGNKVHLQQYIREIYGEDKVGFIVANVMPYLTSNFGLLDMSFETIDGKKVKANNWHLAKELGVDNIKCITEDGEEVEKSKVLVLFRRNSRI